MEKQRRINRKSDFSFFWARGVLPAVLVLLFIGSGSLSSAAGILLKTSAGMTSPADMVNVIRNGSENDEPPEIVLNDGLPMNGAADYVPASSSAKSQLPPDILKLIQDAEAKYANSSNDGKITESDYSTKNATSEFGGAFLRNTTKSHSVNIEEYLKKQVQAHILDDGPAVLVYHTHTTETYELLDRGFYTKQRSSRSENSAENMIRVGEEICRTLEKNGYKTIHDKNIYDEQYSGAYDRSRKAVIRLLADNPSVQVVVDVHRDAIYQKDGSRIKPVTVINGQKAAQIMIISGCEDGNVTDFPNWQKNLTFALHLQQKTANDNAGLMRPLMLCSRKYNMDVMPCAVTVKIGTDANTLSEAVYSAELFGKSLSELLKEYKK